MVTNNSCNVDSGSSGQVLTSSGSSSSFQTLSAIPSIPAWINADSSLYWSPVAFK